jgi:ankyrin repeat protein
VDPRGDHDRTPLHSAADCGDFEMVQILLDYGIDVNAQDYLSSTPLDFALMDHLNDPRVVQLLLEYGADPNIPTNGG